MWGREIAHLDLVTDGRAVVEAAAGVLHRAVLALRRRPRADAVALDRPRRRPARAGDGLPPGAPAHRRGPAGWVGGVRRPRCSCSPPTSSCATPMLGNSEAMLAALVAVGVRAPPRRPSRPRALPRLRRGAAAARGVAVPRPLRALAVVPRARAAPADGARGRGRPGALVRPRAVGLRASRCARRAARTTPNPGSAAFADNPGLEVVKRFARAHGDPPDRRAPLVARVLGVRAWLRDAATPARRSWRWRASPGCCSSP